MSSPCHTLKWELSCDSREAHAFECGICCNCSDGDSDLSSTSKFVRLCCSCVLHYSCLIAYIRSKLGDRQSITLQGVSCPYGCECKSFKTLEGATGDQTEQYYITVNDLDSIVDYGMSHPELKQYLDKNDCKELTHEEVSGLREWIEERASKRYKPDKIFTDNDYDVFVLSTTKACPNCGYRSTHYHGHQCHHVKCPNCQVGYCYKCLSSDVQNKRDRGADSACQCDRGYWVSFCSPITSASDIKSYIAINDGGIPFDKRCGCVICGDCRNGLPCSYCAGDCCVCKGYVNAAPNEVIDTSNLDKKWVAEGPALPFSSCPVGNISLWDCCRHGYVDQLETILQEASFTTEDLNRSDRDGRTGLHLACDAGHTEVIRILLAHPGIDISCKTRRGETPLLTAVANGNIHVVNLLLQHPAILTTDSFFAACHPHRLDILRTLLEHRLREPRSEVLNMKLLLDRSRIHHFNEVVDLLVNHEGTYCNNSDVDEQSTWLKFYNACAKGHVEIVRTLLNDNNALDINRRDTTNDWSPFYVACKYGRKDVVSLLLHRSDLDVNALYDYSKTVLHVACEEGNTAVVHLLLSCPQVDVNLEMLCGVTPLNLACCKTSSAVVRLLLKHPLIDVTKEAYDGWTPLINAINIGCMDIINLLLQHPNIDPNQCDYNDDYTPLHHSMIGNRLDIFNALLTHEKIDVNKVDVDGVTCIYKACCHSHLQDRVMFIQGLLAHHNIDVDKKTLTGYAPLHLVGKNQQDVYRLLLDHKDIDINIRDNDGCTPLMKALMKNETDLISQLLSHPRIDVTVAANDGQTAISIAENKMEVLDELLGHLDEDTQAIYKSRSRLWDCCRHGYVDQLETILQEASFTTEDLNRRDPDGRTGLHLACDAGHTEVVRLLLAHPSTYVSTEPLRSACTNGQTEVVRLLLAHPGMNVNRADEDDTTPLNCACTNGHTEVVRLLLAHPGIDVKQAYIYRKPKPLISACDNGHTEVFRLLLAHPDTYVSTEHLTRACTSGRTEVVRLLLAHPGMNVNRADEDDTTPLSAACGFGHTEVVRLLLAHPGIDVNYHIYSDDNAPLSCACYRGRTEVVSLLLAHPGINVTKAMDRACDGGDTEVISLLLAHPGIDANQAFGLGKTLLYDACGRGRIDVVRLLLAHPGIDVNQATTFSRHTPLNYACANGQTDVVRLLLAHPGIDATKGDNHQMTPLKSALKGGTRCREVVMLLRNFLGIEVD